MPDETRESFVLILVSHDTEVFFFYFVYSSLPTNLIFATGVAGMACKVYELCGSMMTSTSVGTLPAATAPHDNGQ